MPGCIRYGTARPTLAFGGLLKIDSFSLFAKALIYLAAIGALMVAPAFFTSAAAGDRSGVMRAEYPVLVLFACVGMSIMVSANDFMSLYLGLELNSLSAYVLAAILRRDVRSGEAGAEILRARRAGLGDSALRNEPALRLSPAATSFTAVRAGLTGEMGTEGAVRGDLCALRPCLQNFRSAVPHVDARCLRGRADTGNRFLRHCAQGRRRGASPPRVVFEVFGGQVAAWQQIVMFTALASIIFGALGAIGQENLKRLLAYSSINNIGFILLGLAVANQAGASAMLVYLFIYVAMSLGSFVALLMLRGEDGDLF